MRHIDVFNGDADGICALHQLRLATPCPDATLVTGVKRDINLLSQLTATTNSIITVLDISLDRNREDVLRLLDNKNRFFYVDHHYSGTIPASSSLETHIDADPQICTSLIVDQLLGGKFRAWAVVGAYGDNLDEAASRAADTLALQEEKKSILQEVGILLNYNGYGATLEDLFFAPDELFRQVQQYRDPFTFHAQAEALQILRTGYKDDMVRALSHHPLQENSSGRVFQLPGEPWARRVAGVYSNTLARQQPTMAHALLMPNSDGSFRISVRAPLAKREGAEHLCRQFPTGGGRAAAAGINALPAELCDQFLTAFRKQFSPSSAS